MPSKLFQFHTEARSILRGATVLADAVRVTLGQKSKCVLIERRFGKPSFDAPAHPKYLHLGAAW
jgi:chaperonin GroEL